MPGVPVFTSASGQFIYVASFAGLVPVAGATDILVISPGTPGRRVTVLRVLLSGIATAAAAASVSIIKRTTLDTGGTPSPITPVLMNPNVSGGALISIPSTALVQTYTANPAALGTATAPLGGVIGSAYMALGTATAPQPQFEAPQGLVAAGFVPLLLPTDQLCVNLNAGTFAGNLLNGSIYFTDEAYN